MSKRLTKTIWYGSDVDSNGNPILPSTHGGLDGLNYGELFLHLSNGKATLWTLSSDGKIVEITGGGSEVDMSSYLLKSIWDKVFEIRTDSQGTEYIFGKLPMVTQYGITMYSGDGVDVPSLASGLPFDGRTIWYNPDTNQIEVIGGTGGGSGEGVSNFCDLSGIPSWITNSKPKYSYSEIEGTPDLSGYATESWVLGKSYITSATLGTELGKYVTLDTDQSLKGKKDFKNGLSIDGLELRKSQDDVVYLDANLVVRGGVTMYAQNEVDIPSIIDSIPTASTTVKGIASFDGAYFSVVNGKVSLIASNVGLNEEELYNYLTSNNYAKKTDIPSLVGYATQSWVNTRIDSLINGAPAAYDTLKEIADVLQGNVNSIGDIITALGTKWTQDNTKIANWDTAYSWGNHANVGYALKSYVDSTFVTLGSTQTITGEKNFTGGLKVNGSPIVYDATKKYWKLEGDLLVTGGVTMYGNEGTYTSSTIMDAILYDDTTLGINSNGQLYVKGGAGGGINTTDLQNYLTQNSYLNVTSGDNRYLKLSGGDLSGNIYINTYASNRTAQSYIRINKGSEYFGMGASASNISVFSLGTVNDDNTWKKEAIQIYDNGTVNFSNTPTVDANIVLHAGNYSRYALSLNGGTMNGVITMPINYQIQWGSSSMMIYGEDTNAIKIVAPLGLYVNSKEVWNSGNDGSGSGLDADLLDGKHADSFMNFNANTTYVGASMGNDNLSKLASGDGHIEFWDSAGGWFNGKWGKLIAVSGFEGSLSGNASSATKLQTARTIWGQSFDGTGNVSGNLTLENNYEIVTKNTSGSISSTLYRTKSNNLSIGEGIAKESNDTYISGNNLFLRYGTGLTNGISLISSGNVGIGTTSPSYTLDVSGTCRASTSVTSNMFFTNGEYGIWKGSSFTGGLSVNDLVYYAEKNVFYGNVGIGTTSPGYKLHVEGSGGYFGFLFINQYGASGNKSGASLIINKGGDYFGIGPSNTNVESMSFGATSDATGTWKSEMITINRLGAVGIGTSNPSSRLHVNGVLTLPLNNQVQWTDSGGAMIYGTSGKRIMVDGDILATGGITMYSMRALKNVVDERGLSLSELSTIKPTRYTWKDGRDNRLHFGGIADDIQQVLPEVVYSTSDGILTMDYGNAAFAVASSLIQPVVDHEKRIAMLENENKQLRQEVERLKSA